MSSEPHAYPAWGAEVPADHPEGWVGDVDSHRIAYPARVKRAQEFFPQAPFADFEVQQTGLDRYRLIDKATGTAYRVVGYDPLLSEQPRNCAVSVFTVDAGGSLLYLRREDTPEQPVEAPVTDWTTARKEAAS
jgi:hypothetical protein